MSSAKTLRITDQIRQELKKPLGELISGTFSDCNNALRLRIQETKPPKVIMVGDTVSRNAIQSAIRADVIIVDNKEMRHETGPFRYGSRTSFRITNAQGAINSISWNVVKQAIEMGNAAVIVEGEEDLLTLVAISESPMESLVVYGQPGEGIVMVSVSEGKKQEVLRLTRLMNSD